MPLEIVGAGYGRTGTFTLKTVLEQIGFSKCYHMADVFEDLSRTSFGRMQQTAKPSIGKPILKATRLQWTGPHPPFGKSSVSFIRSQKCFFPQDRLKPGTRVSPIRSKIF